MEIYRMKLFRFGQPDHEKPAVLVDGRRLDVSEFGEDYNEPFFAADGVACLLPGTQEGQQSASLEAAGSADYLFYRMPVWSLLRSN
jgi:hypothetical protein